MALTDEQQRVYEWLNDDLSLPVFAEAYRGAAVLLAQKSTGYISFVAHAGRDLMNGLASTAAGVKSGRVQYQSHLDTLQSDWQDEWRYSDDLAPEVIANGHLIPVSVCQRISTLIEEHKAGRMRSTEASRFRTERPLQRTSDTPRQARRGVESSYSQFGPIGLIRGT